MRHSKRAKRQAPEAQTQTELDGPSTAEDSLQDAELIHKTAHEAIKDGTGVRSEKEDGEDLSDWVADSPTEEEKPAPADHGGEQRPDTIRAGYNSVKSFNGQYYTGMSVGRSHRWHYEPGVWTETKKEPDLWDIDYTTNKNRARRAPAGSGAPVGTEYHWMIIAHQHVKKIDANTYKTKLTGSKYKLCHKRAAAASWSIPTVKGQRERELELLEDAKRRVKDLPPVLAGEKVKSNSEEAGQRKLEDLWNKMPPSEPK